LLRRHSYTEQSVKATGGRAGYDAVVVGPSRRRSVGYWRADVGIFARRAGRPDDGTSEAAAIIITIAAGRRTGAADGHQCTSRHANSDDAYDAYDADRPLCRSGRRRPGGVGLVVLIIVVGWFCRFLVFFIFAPISAAAIGAITATIPTAGHGGDGGGVS